MENSLREIVELLEKMDARNEIRFKNLEDRFVWLGLERSGSDRDVKSLHEDVVATKLAVKDLKKMMGSK